MTGSSLPPESSSRSDADPTPILLAARRRDVARAANLVVGGDIVGGWFGTVYGLMADGMQRDLGSRIADLKGRRRLGRPLSVCIPEARLSRLLDADQIHPSARALALDGEALSRTVSSLCFLRAPIRQSVVADLPEHLVSYADGVPYLQSLDPGGLPGASSLMSRLWRRGVQFPAITSMNHSGQPEIVEHAAAVRFSRDTGLPALLGAARRPQAHGSFTILEIGPHGLRAARHGVIPVPVLQRLIDEPIDDSLTEWADFAALDVPDSLLTGLSHQAACRAALLRLNTALPSGVVRAIARAGVSHPRARITRAPNVLQRSRRRLHHPDGT